MKTSCLYILLLFISIVGCKNDEHTDFLCTDDCPGVIGTDGKFYCNECYARRGGVDVVDHMTTFYWAETQCADPWQDIQNSTSCEDEWSAIEAYLADLGITVYESYEVYHEELIAFCAACTCGTGSVFIITAGESHASELIDIGFYETAPKL